MFIVAGSAAILFRLTRFTGLLRNLGSKFDGKRIAELVYEPAYIAIAAALGIALGAFMIGLGAIGGFA